MELPNVVEGDVTVQGALTYEGQITGSVVVPMGCRLDLGGKIGGDLKVEEGGYALVRGTVAGDMVNLGGNVQIDGTIGGQLLTDAGPHAGTGTTAISKGASIAGEIVT